jgi:hypothetical protein
MAPRSAKAARVKEWDDFAEQKLTLRRALA